MSVHRQTQLLSYQSTKYKIYVNEVNLSGNGRYIGFKMKLIRTFPHCSHTYLVNVISKTFVSLFLAIYITINHTFCVKNLGYDTMVN